MIRVQGLDLQWPMSETSILPVFLHYWGGTGRTWGLVIENWRTATAALRPIFAGWGGSTRKR